MDDGRWTIAIRASAYIGDGPGAKRISCVNWLIQPIFAPNSYIGDEAVTNGILRVNRPIFATTFLSRILQPGQPAGAGECTPWLPLFGIDRDERAGDAVDLLCQTLGGVHSLCPHFG